MGAAAGAAALGKVDGLRSLDALAQKTNVTVWAAPFAGTYAPQYDAWLNKTAPKALPDVQISSDYGPGQYAPMQSKYLIQAKSGTPDVIEGVLENLVTYIKAGLIIPLDDRFSAWADKSQFLQSALNGVMYNGQLYGIPYNLNARGMLYRKSVLKKLGLKVPTTWDELVNTAEAITAKMQSTVSMQGLGLCTDLTDPRGSQEWLSFFFQLNKHMFKLDPTTKKWALNTTPAEVAKVNQLYYNLFLGNANTPAVDPRTRGTNSYIEDPGYVTGLWAMVPMGPWIIGRQTQGALQKQILLEDTGVASLPVAPGGTHASYLEDKPYMINKYSKNPDAAWATIQYLASAQAMAFGVHVEGYTAPRQDVLSLPAIKSNWWVSSFAEIAPQGVALDPINWDPVNLAITTQTQSVIYGKATPMQAATTLCNQINHYLAQGLL
jgi:ABC-type glycerol-3-phosphate transport system substrate-binding protein